VSFRSRSRERKLAIAGDFPDTGESITEILDRVRLNDTEIHGHVHHDDTPAFDGASAGTMPPAEAHREAGLRQAVAMTDPDTQPLRLRAQPAPLPPPQPHYTPAAPRDTGPMPKLSRYAARPRPQRPADGAIFKWSPVLEQHIMLCGVCPPERRNRYADPIAGTLPFAFEALRVSAWTAGWRLDAFDRWGCPACQLTPAWHARYTVTLWAEGAGWARLHHDPDAEWGAIAIAEQDLIRDVADAAKQGRHSVMT
jgi:hypothetical protein